MESVIISTERGDELDLYTVEAWEEKIAIAMWAERFETLLPKMKLAIRRICNSQKIYLSWRE